MLCVISSYSGHVGLMFQWNTRVIFKTTSVWRESWSHVTPEGPEQIWENTSSDLSLKNTVCNAYRKAVRVKPMRHKSRRFRTSSLTAPPAWQPAAPPPSSSAPSAFSPPSSSWQWPLTSAYPAQLPRPCGPTAWPPPRQSGPSLPAGLPSPQIAARE